MNRRGHRVHRGIRVVAVLWVGHKYKKINRLLYERLPPTRSVSQRRRQVRQELEMRRIWRSVTKKQYDIEILGCVIAHPK